MKQDKLILSVNGKTKSTRYHYNTFGLMYGLPKHGGTCPGATSGCGGCLNCRCGKRETCYAAKVCQVYPGVSRILRKNTRLLMGKTQKEMVPILTRTVENFIERSNRLRDKPKELVFRLAWCGDFFNVPYTKAWVEVIPKFPQVKFWGYTRSLFAIPYLKKCKNASWFISTDPVNWKRVRAFYKKHRLGRLPNWGLSWMGDSPPAEMRWFLCPAITGKIKHDKARGACPFCKFCINLKKHALKNVHFPLH